MKKFPLDALQWAIDEADSIKKRDDRSQEERNYLHELEQLRNDLSVTDRAYKRPT